MKDCNGDQRQLYKTLNRITQCNKSTLYSDEDAFSLHDKFGMFFNNKINETVQNGNIDKFSNLYPYITPYPI